MDEKRREYYKKDYEEKREKKCEYYKKVYGGIPFYIFMEKYDISFLQMMRILDDEHFRLAIKNYDSELTRKIGRICVDEEKIIELMRKEWR